MKVRIGNQTSFSASTVMQPFEYAVDNGFDAFEWFPDKRESGEGWTERDLTGEMRAFIRETALSKDISFSVHASWETNPLRQASKEPLDRAIELARDIGATLLNLHLYLDEGVKAYGDAIAPLIGRLSEIGLRLSIENTPRTRPEDFNELFRYLRSEGPGDLSHLGMCFDLGHANLCAATRNDYLRFMDLLDPAVPIIHAHLHENYGEADTHLPLFTGPSGRDSSGIRGVIERLQRRSFSGSIILEQWPQPPTLLLEARNRLLALLGGQEDAGQPSGNPPGDDFVRRITDADRQFRSWRRKLSWVHDVLTDESRPPDREMLIYLAVYLRFIGTGAVSCSEEGGHFRPSHHARTSREIYDHLVKMTTAENAFVIRKILPWLPSFDAAFVRHEPLTRIRDIAHRNDIPRQLKEEIKHTLQNKLHRSAGPEDLVTSAGLLDRITRPDAGYSPAFVEEFIRFHEELKEFFNARSLEEHLEKIAREGDGEVAKSIQDFLGEKERAKTPGQIMTVLRILTALRRRFKGGLPEEIGPARRQYEMADIRLEDFSFVLLSRLINTLEPMQHGMPWEVVLESLALTVENLRMSGLDSDECLALESEIKAWSLGFTPADHVRALRLKATLDRCRRLAERYAREVLSLFPERAERLGSALAVGEQTRKLYAEGDLRSHPVFQLSKLVSVIRKNIPLLAGLSPWDVIVTGRASGLLVRVPGISDLSPSGEGPVIAFVERVEGDEEIPAAVVGVIIGHEIPHLSHLAIRARQGKVVFAACQDDGRIEELRAFAGKRVTLNASAEKVDVAISAVPGGSRANDCHRALDLPKVILSPQSKVLTLSQVGPETGGSKAFGVRRLQELSQLPGSGFRALPGLVIPFGIMEASLHAAPADEEQYLSLIAGLNELTREDLDEASGRLREILSRLPVPEEIIAAVTNYFRENDRLMVRSSSNSEDLSGFSGAGVYESVANVPRSEVARAIGRVWSSLWTRLAVESRRHAGVSHESVHMAVLIQPMKSADYSFVLHTVNPVNGSPEEVYLELAVGMGETLTSGNTGGTPYRMMCRKGTEEVRTLALASFSKAIWPDPSGGIERRVVDYSVIGLSVDDSLRDRIGSRLGRAGKFLEDELGGPQDIEGFISGDTIYLVQSRLQQGVDRDVAPEQ